MPVGGRRREITVCRRSPAAAGRCAATPPPARPAGPGSAGTHEPRGRTSQGEGKKPSISKRSIPLVATVKVRITGNAALSFKWALDEQAQLLSRAAAIPEILRRWGDREDRVPRVVPRNEARELPLPQTGGRTSLRPGRRVTRAGGGPPCSTWAGCPILGGPPPAASRPERGGRFDLGALVCVIDSRWERSRAP